MPAAKGGSTARATGGAAKTQTTPNDASRIQSSQAKGGNDTGKGTFSARVQSAAAKNTTASTAGAGAKGVKGGKAI